MAACCTRSSGSLMRLCERLNIGASKWDGCD
jgi:hypothetical protein